MGVKYNDNLCIFRCLALQHGLRKYRLEGYAKDLCTRFETHRGKEYKDGMSINDIIFIEQWSKISINVYNLKEDGTAEIIYISPLDFTDTMHLNLHESHFSFIRNFKAFSKKYTAVGFSTTLSTYTSI